MTDRQAFDPQVRAALLGLLRRAQRNRLGNRAIACVLACACAYLLLLLALLLFALPLLLFHLLFYVCLALLPLLLVLEDGLTRTVLRGLDDRCQLESFLSAVSPQHRAYLRPHVLRVLDRRARERVLPFRLHRWNIRLAAAAAGLLLLFLAAGWVTFGSVRPTLSPAALASRRAQAEAVDFGKAPGARPAGRTAGPAEKDDPTAAEEAGVAGAGGREPGEAGRPPGRGGAEGVAAGVPPDSPGGEPPPPEQREAGSGSTALLPAPVEPGQQGAVPGQASGEGRQQPLLPGGSEAGSGSTGRSLLESPLREYRSRADRVQAEGGESLAANPGTATPLEPELLPARFFDFPLWIPPSEGFDPDIQGIGRRYLEALDARY